MRTAQCGRSARTKHRDEVIEWLHEVNKRTATTDEGQKSLIEPIHMIERKVADINTRLDSVQQRVSSTNTVHELLLTTALVAKQRVWRFMRDQVTRRTGFDVATS